MEEASQLYYRAGNLYKGHKNYSKAHDCYIAAAELYRKLKDTLEYCYKLSDAAQAAKFGSDTTEAISLLQQVVSYLSENGNFGLAAKHCQDLAELHEMRGEMPVAIEFYEKSADLHESVNGKPANSVLLKVAELRSLEQQYEKAAALFQAIGEWHRDNSKADGSQYYFRSLLCWLAFDFVAVSKHLEEFKLLYPTFADSSYCKDMSSLVASAENRDAQAFDDLVGHGTKTSFDAWKNEMLKRAKINLFGSNVDGPNELL